MIAELMGSFLSSLAQEIPKLAGSIILLLMAWFVGLRLTMQWNIKQKKREADIACAREFQNLYGEFFSIWKLWNAYKSKQVGFMGTDNVQWEVFKQACKSEGNMEAIVVRLASERSLSAEELNALGEFRQLYQELRQSIRANEPLRWMSSNDPNYIKFKRLGSIIANITIGSDLSSHKEVEEASRQLIEITSNRHEIRRREGSR